MNIPTDWPLWKRRLGIYPDDDQEDDDYDFDEPDDEDLELDDLDGTEDEDLEDETDDPESEEPEPEDLGLVLGPKPDTTKSLDPLDNREFQSWTDFVKCATDDSLYAWKHQRASHVHSDRFKGSGSQLPWNGTSTWEECVTMATRTGWPEGRAMLEDSLAIVRPRPEPYKSIELSVAGAYPMVPNYCAGDPECMVIDPGSDMRHSKPIIRIDFNNWTHAGVTPKSMMLRGAAVVSLAETLERRGYSTELRIVGISSAGSTDFKYTIVFKKAGETLDIDRAAFAIAHPAVMRRLCFALLEQHASAERDYGFGYGRPTYKSVDPTSGQPGGAIFVGPSTGRETAETARDAVTKAAETLLSEINASEAVGDD